MVAHFDGIGKMSRDGFYIKKVLVGIPIPVLVDYPELARWSTGTDFVLDGVPIRCRGIVEHHQIGVNLVDDDRVFGVLKTYFTFRHTTTASAEDEK